MSKPEYLTHFLVNALRDELPSDVHLEINRIVQYRLFYMTPPMTASFLGMSSVTLRRKIRKDKLLRSAGIQGVGQGRATIYPFWVVHELLALSGGLDQGDDQSDESDDDDVFRS